MRTSYHMVIHFAGGVSNLLSSPDWMEGPLTPQTTVEWVDLMISFDRTHVHILSVENLPLPQVSTKTFINFTDWWAAKGKPSRDMKNHKPNTSFLSLPICFCRWFISSSNREWTAAALWVSLPAGGHICSLIKHNEPFHQHHRRYFVLSSVWRKDMKRNLTVLIHVQELN